VHVVENSVAIARPAEAVFDFVSDMRTEADWNPAVKSIRLLSGEPIDVGTRFEGEFAGLGAATMEVVEFVRPATWTVRTVAARLPFRLVGRVTPAIGGAVRLTIRIELLPTGAMAVVAPVLRLVMQRTARGNMGRIRAALEG
jgi:Polyketide cyclase / dehydrase and lipid transport